MFRTFAIALLGVLISYLTSPAQSPPGATPAAGEAGAPVQPPAVTGDTAGTESPKAPDPENKKPRDKERRRSSGAATGGFGRGLGGTAMKVPENPRAGFAGVGPFIGGGMTGMGSMAGGGLMGAGGPGDTASLLERALRYSPDVQLAEAKLRTAEAELNKARLEVAKTVIGLEHSVASQQRIIDLDRIRVQQAREAYKRAEEIVKKGAAPTSSESTASLALKEAESELISAEARLSELRETLRYMMGGALGMFSPGMPLGGSGAGNPMMPGSPMPGASGPPPTSFGNPPPPAATSLPAGSSGGGTGPVSGASRYTIKLPPEAADSGQNNLRRKLQSPTQIQVKDVEPKELAKYLADLHGVPILLDPNAAANAQTISIDIHDVPLHAALQAIEDTHPHIRFFVRDYGILIALSEDDAAAHKAVPVREFMQARTGGPAFGAAYGIGLAGEYVPVEIGLASGADGRPGRAKPAKSDKRQTRIFKLRHAAAREVAGIVQQTIGNKANAPLQVSPDERTNALVVVGDEKDLQEVEALLINLDVPSTKSEKPTPKK